MSTFEDLSDEEKELIRLARRKGIRPKDLENVLLTSPKLKPAGKEEEKDEEMDITKMIDKIQKKALEMKLNLAILEQMGLGGDGKDDIKELIKELTSRQENTIKELKETIKEVLEEKHEKGDKLSTSEMMNMVIMLKALGGEKSTDWKDFLVAMKELMQKPEAAEKGIDPLALIDKIQEVQERTYAQAREQAQAQTINVPQPQEEEETLEKFISKQTLDALKEQIAQNIKEVFNPQKKLVNEKGQVDYGALAEKIIGIVSDTIKRIPINAPPPRPREEFEQPPPPEVQNVGNEVPPQTQQEVQPAEVQQAPPLPPEQQHQQEKPKLPIEEQGE